MRIQYVVVMNRACPKIANKVESQPFLDCIVMQQEARKQVFSCKDKLEHHTFQKLLDTRLMHKLDQDDMYRTRTGHD